MEWEGATLHSNRMSMPAGGIKCPVGQGDIKLGAGFGISTGNTARSFQRADTGLSGIAWQSKISGPKKQETVHYLTTSTYRLLRY